MNTEGFEELTHRELEVLALLATGKTNKEIAAALGIEVGTIEQHLHNIFRKLKVGTRTEAVLHALRYGLVRLV